MTAAPKERPVVCLPIDPVRLAEANLEPIARGRAYNALDGGLDSWQRQCVEEALRMVLSGTYPGTEAAE